MKFEDIINLNNIYLYLGDLPRQRIIYTNINFIGLSLTKSDNYHIKHDVLKPISLKKDLLLFDIFFHFAF